MVHPPLAFRMGVAFLLAVLPHLGPNSAASARVSASRPPLAVA